MSMENQHRKIAGYRDLTEAEIAMMNKIKAHAAATEALLAEVYGHLGAQYHATEARYAEPKDEADEVVGTEPLDTPEETAAKTEERHRLNKAEIFRWHALSKTHLQEGFMALTRSVAQPTTF